MNLQYRLSDLIQNLQWQMGNPIIPQIVPVKLNVTHLVDLHFHLLLGGAVSVPDHRQHTAQLLMGPAGCMKTSECCRLEMDQLLLINQLGPIAVPRGELSLMTLIHEWI